ncbi:apolipoprotein D-like isoform X2 [Ostrinia nubilalis]
MSLIKKIVVFLCGVISLDMCAAQVLLPGSCPNVSVVQDFNASQYLGKWYEQEKYFFIFELGGKCVIAEYEDKGNGTISVKNEEINVLKGNKKTSIELVGTLENPNEGRLAVSFPLAPNGFAAPYLIVGTDYTGYAVVNSCISFGLFNLSYAWILTRDQTPSDSVMQAAYDVVDKNGIARKYFLKTDQTDCDSS